MLNIVMTVVSLTIILAAVLLILGLGAFGVGRYDLEHRNPNYYDWTPMGWSLPWKWTVERVFVPIVSRNDALKGVEYRVVKK